MAAPVALGDFCNFTNAGVTFEGIAHSINFGGTAGNTGYDNVTFGSAVAGGGVVPEPYTWAMMLLGFGMLGTGMRYRRRGTKGRVRLILMSLHK